MPHDPDIEMDEMMEEMAEDLGRERGPETTNSHSGGYGHFSFGWPFLLGGIFLVLLIAFLVSFLLRGEGISEGDLESVTNGLVRIENRLAKLEEIEKKSVEFEKQIQELKNSISELQQFRMSADGRLGDLSRKISQAREKSPTQQSNSNTKLSKSSTRRGQYHIVKRGETLFGISRKYGVSIEELRKINNLKSGKDIYPDQRLLIVP